MPSELLKSQTLNALTNLLYDFLPGSGNNNYSFPLAAQQAGVMQYWQLEGRSKRPTIYALLESTLTYRRDRFCELIVAIVKLSIGWRNSKKNPLTLTEVKKLNELLLQLEFKIPDLHNPSFLKSLLSQPEAEKVDNQTDNLQEELSRQKLQNILEHNQKRDLLRQNFESLCCESDAQKRGYQLEKFLNRFFALEGFDPRASFKNIGEQIDGSFVLNDRVYLLEAKWTKSQSEGKDFGAFMYKLEGKAIDTRGLFVSINGFTATALQNLKTKGATRFICIDGAHIHRALNAQDYSLKDLLQDLWRHASETGEAYLPIIEMSKKAV